METTKPTVVFVHGAWADNSGFDGSIRALRGQGFRAIGASNPLRELRSDAAYVAALLRSIEGPIVMVGHSYGGAVISNAATGNDQVQALVYINGWVPDEGESLIQLAELNEGSLIPDSLQPVQYKNADGSDVVDLYIDQPAGGPRDRLAEPPACSARSGVRVGTTMAATSTSCWHRASAVSECALVRLPLRTTRESGERRRSWRLAEHGKGSAQLVVSRQMIR